MGVAGWREGCPGKPQDGLQKEEVEALKLEELGTWKPRNQNLGRGKGACELKGTTPRPLTL